MPRLPTDSEELGRFEIWLRGEVNSIDENDADLIGDFVLELLKNMPPDEEEAKQFLFAQLEEITGEDTAQLVDNVLFSLSPNGRHIWLPHDEDSRWQSTLSDQESAGSATASSVDIPPPQMHKLDSSQAAAGLLNFPPSNSTTVTPLLPVPFPMLPLPYSSGSTQPQFPAFPIFPPLDSSMPMWSQALPLPLFAQLLPSGGSYDPATPRGHTGVDVDEARKTKIDTRRKKAKEQEEQRLAIEGQIKRIEEDRAKLLEAIKTKASPLPRATTKIGDKKQVLEDQAVKIEAGRGLTGKDGLATPQARTRGSQKDMFEQQIRKIEEERTKLLDALRVKGVASAPKSTPIDNQKQTLEQQISEIEQERTKLLDVLKAKGEMSPPEPQSDSAKSERIAALRRQLAEKQAEARALGLIDDEGNDIPDARPAYRGRGGSSYRGGYVPRGHSYHPYRRPYRGFSGASRGYRGRGY